MERCDVAFGVMCKAPIEGACKTRLCPPLTPREAAELSRAFLADVAHGVERLGAGRGVAVYTPEGSEEAFAGLLPDGFGMLPQRGADLGERLRSAFDDLFAAGHRAVCLIGADSPTLPPAALRSAIAALAAPGERVVLGPAIDGGYYLIGLKQARPALFEEIAWSSAGVLAQTLARAAELALPLSLLPPWCDVDDLDSLRLLLHELFGRGAPLAVDGLEGAPAPFTRELLGRLLRAPGAERLGFPAALVRERRQ